MAPKEKRKKKDKSNKANTELMLKERETLRKRKDVMVAWCPNRFEP
jgi:UDP-N-acetyl-D-mannosaminuronate dehydrogenase